MPDLSIYPTDIPEDLQPAGLWESDVLQRLKSGHRRRIDAR